MNDLEEIPAGSKRIWEARIYVEIVRVKYKKKYKDKFNFLEVYKDGQEKIKDSYLMRNIRSKLELDKDEEEFKITQIEKIKYIGFSLPDII